MSAGAEELRDPQLDPRVGDFLQVIPPFNRALPAPMTVIAVDDRRVTWTRDGREFSTDRVIWELKDGAGGERRIVFAQAVRHG